MSRSSFALLALPGAAAALVAVALLLAAPAPRRRPGLPRGDEDYTFLPCGRSVMNDRQRDESDAIDERDWSARRSTSGLPDTARSTTTSSTCGCGSTRMRRRRGRSSPSPGASNSILDDDRETYELLALVDGITGNVLLYRNTDTTTRGQSDRSGGHPGGAELQREHPHGVDGVRPGPPSGRRRRLLPQLRAAVRRPGAAQARSRYPGRGLGRVVERGQRGLDGDFACHDGAGGQPGFSDVDSDRTVLESGCRLRWRKRRLRRRRGRGGQRPGRPGQPAGRADPSPAAAAAQSRRARATTPAARRCSCSARSSPAGGAVAAEESNQAERAGAGSWASSCSAPRKPSSERVRSK